MRGFMSYLKTGRVALAALGLLTAVAATTTVAAPARADWDDHRGYDRGYDRDDHWRHERWEQERREQEWREHAWRARHTYYPAYGYYAPAYVYPQPGISFGFVFH
ncbi:MAG: hypothetical protein EPO08_10770 [Rhodospirillaceae bacterium]|nr:MAG: hypothetical protein EPO08_10770 [Rhodospirillaceae bacterium]